LKDAFPRLFFVSVKEDRVADMGSRVSGQWVRSWRWKRPLFVWEEEVFNELEATLGGVGHNLEGSDGVDLVVEQC